MPPPKQDTEQLVRSAGRGDKRALEGLFSRHRSRLRRMIAVRMDPRLSARVDPSDVVQEVLAEAARKLPAYARAAPLPFFPWLRMIAWDHLVNLYHRHVRAQKRCVAREEHPRFDLPEGSALSLAQRVVASGTSPSGRVLREELRQRVRRALDQLAPADREILVMRHLEQLQVSEIAALLGITEAAVKMRRLRAAERLRALLEEKSADGLES